MSDATDWISAVSTALAMGFAGTAAVYAAKSWGSAKKQVQAAERQVEAAYEQVRIAEAATQRQEERAAAADERADRAENRELLQVQAAEERFIKAQLDARAPYVYLRTRDGYSGLAGITYNEEVLSPAPLIAALPKEASRLAFDPEARLHNYEPKDGTEIPSAEDFLFVVTITVDAVNVSDYPARINVIDIGEFDVLGDFRGNDIIVPQRGAKTVVLRRVISSAEIRASGTSAGIADFKGCVVYMKFWARDFSYSVRDELNLGVDLRFFAMDGQRIIVSRTPAFLINETADMGPARVYERIEAAKEQADASLANP
ncbi:hypothetical protein [Amycolatopsis sp. DSM 110486]|uniref:hypothetical protein n=1 Tax=Amycolatopsis sp. DSM 110486 TaxID=2865832 RepID=UPI001C6A0731|nr:hypothetical protein [Amycolatopsis sp. DSM 110486]QYN16848.1 hypothetical protein K1T34_28805 [Amycolatopsis sp. DSM 110486]